MLTTILDEAVNGWIVTVFKDGVKQQFIYERLADAQGHLEGVYLQYGYARLKGGLQNVTAL